MIWLILLKMYSNIFRSQNEKNFLIFLSNPCNRDPRSWNKCQEVVVRTVFSFVTRSELEVQRKGAQVSGLCFHQILVESLKELQMTCIPATFLGLRVNALPEVTQLVQEGLGLESSLQTQFLCSFQGITWFLLFFLFPLIFHHSSFLPLPLSFYIHFLHPLDVTHRMEKFFEFLGWVGLVGLGNLLTEAWMCFQDVGSPGASRVPMQCIGLC